MPVRTASLTKRIAANGQALHRAIERRIVSFGEAHEPSEAESALLEERRQLKAERDKLKAQGRQRRPSAVERLLRTHHPLPKAQPKAKKEATDAKGAKPAKAHKTRAEKQAAAAAALDAARKSAKKPAAK